MTAEDLQRRLAAALAQSAEQRERHERLVEDLCRLIPEDEGDDVAVEAIIVRWVTTAVSERDRYRAALERIGGGAGDPWPIARRALQADPGRQGPATGG